MGSQFCLHICIPVDQLDLARLYVDRIVPICLDDDMLFAAEAAKSEPPKAWKIFLRRQDAASTVDSQTVNTNVIGHSTIHNRISHPR